MKLSNTVLLYKMEREKAMYWLSTKKAKIIMLLPTLMIYAVFIIIPVFIAIYYSFTDYSGLGKASFVGIKNYIAMFHDKLFLIALKNTFLILPYVAVNISFNTLLFTGFLRDIPGELEEAAIIDGCNLFNLCTKVVIPVMKPTFVTIIIFNAVYIYNEFPFASTFIQNNVLNTVSLMTSMFKGQYSMDYSGIIAASLMIILPELVFYVILQKYIISGMTAGAVKG